MGETEISWTHRKDTVGRSWNPTQGCAMLSEGCRNCYAQTLAARFSKFGWSKGLINDHGKWNGMARLAAHKLSEPLTWRKPSTVFVNSMSDLFYEGFTNEQIAAVFGVMAACPQHTFIVLTKRAKRMRAWFAWVQQESEHPLSTCGREWVSAMEIPVSSRSAAGRAVISPGAQWPLPNVWLGVSVENQDAADERIPDLLATPAAVRFLSCEPLLGKVDLDKPRCDDPYHGDAEWSETEDGTPWCHECHCERSYGHWLSDDGGLDWVIAGCESGRRARDCDVAWLRSLRDQCRADCVPMFLKQAMSGCGCPPRHTHNAFEGCETCTCTWSEGDRMSCESGIAAGPGSYEKRGGVIERPYLDGRQHLEFPA